LYCKLIEDGVCEIPAEKLKLTLYIKY